MPAWYGLGSALAMECAENGAEQLRAIAADFRFFAAVLRSVERVLAIADLEIFARYAAALVDPPELRERFMTAIRDEYHRTKRTVLEILGATELLEHDPVLARSIALRNPYVDPVSLLQVRLLRQLRVGTSSATLVKDAIRTSITGVAAGLRVTG